MSDVGVRLSHVPKPLNAEPPQPGGFSLAKVALRTAQDVVSLSRRTRAAGEEFGLHPRSIRNLLAATYEIGPASGRPGAVCRRKCASSTARRCRSSSGWRWTTPRALAPLHCACSRSGRSAAQHGRRDSDHREAAELSICLRALFPTGAADVSAPVAATREVVERRSDAEDDRRRRSAREALRS